jgi:hypothetical protein
MAKFQRAAALAAAALLCSAAPAAAAPVQVFVMMGQSNMLGMGKVSGNTNGTLEFAVHNESKCAFCDAAAPSVSLGLS